MNISVLTPDNEVFYGEITSVRVPSANGEFQVLKNHAPIVSSLGGGKVEIVVGAGAYRIFNEATKSMEEQTDNGKRVTFRINGGFIEVLNNEISLLVRGVEF